MNEDLETLFFVFVLVWTIGSWIVGLLRRLKQGLSPPTESIPEEAYEFEEEYFSETEYTETQPALTPTSPSFRTDEYGEAQDEYAHIRYVVEKLGVEVPEALREAAGIEISERESVETIEEKTASREEVDIEEGKIRKPDDYRKKKGIRSSQLIDAYLTRQAVRDAIVLQSMLSPRNRFR